MWCAEGSIGQAVVDGVAVEGGDLVDTLDIVKCEARRPARTWRGSLSASLRAV